MNRTELIILLCILFLILAVVGLAFLSAHPAARDRIRTADIGKIDQALAAFYNENGYYPAAVEGVPSGIKDYLESWPSPPHADGSCTVDQNSYRYAPKLAGDDYNLSFCLGHSYAGFPGGPQILTSKGLK